MLQLKYKGKRWRKPDGKIASKAELLSYLENKGYKVYNQEKIKTSWHIGILKKSEYIKKIYCFLQLVSSTNTRRKSKSVIEYRVETYTEEAQDPVYMTTDLTSKMKELLKLYPLKGNAKLQEYNYEINDKREIKRVEKENIGKWKGYAEYRNPLASGRVKVYLYEAEGDPLIATGSSKYTIDIKNKSFVEG